MSAEQVIAYLTSIDYAGWGDTIGKFVKDWQTLIAGVLALASAWATVASVNRQIQHSTASEENRRHDEARAARAVMPLALSELSGYAEGCMRVLASIDGVRDEFVLLRGRKQLPPPPVALIGHFKEAIRFSESAEREQMASLLAWFQVHEARLSPLRPSGAGPEALSLGIPQAIVDAAELHARATKLFHWARGNLERFPRSDVQASVRQCLLDCEAHPDVMRILNTRPRPPVAD